MKLRKPLVAAVAGTAAFALAACSGSSGGGGKSGGNSAPKSGGSSSSSSSAQVGNVVNPGYTTKGGTVNILNQADFEHLDPVENYVTNSGEVGRLLYRTLTMIKDTPGKKPQVVPDLASSLGKSSDGGKTWTWPLRSGVKYEDGKTVTAADIKYNIERDFDRTTYPDGPSYMADLVAAPASYKGPYTSGSLPNSAVDASKSNELTVHFNSPQPDADWIMTLFYTAPVPKAKDTKKNYDKHPISSGPYMIKSYNPGKNLQLTRNPYWSASTDPNRPALPNGFNITTGISLPTISQRLISSSGSDANAVTLENSGALQNGDVGKVQAVKSRFVNGPSPCVDYEFMNTQKIKDVDVRKAIALAINRNGILTQYGGSLFGSISDTILTSTLEGYAPPKLPLKSTGDPSAAKALLKGKTVPTINYGVASGSVKQSAIANQVQNDLKAVGIKVTISQIPQDSYYTQVRSNNGPDMGRAGWCWDWPTSASVVPQVLGANAGLTTWSDSNFSKFFVKSTAQKIKDLQNSTDSPAVIGKGYNDITNQIQQQDWPLLPTIASNDPQVVGSNIQNAGVGTAYGEIDLITIGVKH